MLKTPWLLALAAAFFTDREIELKTGADYCYSNPLTTFVTGAQRNADIWPDPCEHIVTEYETSGTRAKYDKYYQEERREMIEQLRKIK